MMRMVAALTLLATPVAAQQHEHHVQVDTLTVHAERNPIRLRSGASVVDVRASEGVSGSIADLLRTVPGIEVDPDGGISMRGSSSMLVLMNGRRIALTGDALVAFLRQMPATALERIEAGTTASARQSADGAGGVVNLVFRDDATRRTGMRSLAGSVASDDHYMASGAISGNASNILSWDAMYSLSNMRPRTERTTARWSVVPGDIPFQTDEDSRARAKHRLHSILMGAAATPTPNTSLALRGSYSWMEGAYRNSTAFVYTDAAGNRGTSANRSLLEHAIPSGEVSAAASLKGARLRFSSEARTGFVDEDFRGTYDEDAGYRYLTTIMDSRQRDHVLRNDLDMRFDAVSVDVGHESQFRTTTATHDATHFDARLLQNYRYETDVHAGYVTAHRSVGGVRAEAGLRVESDRTHLELGEFASARSALRWFPSISGEWLDRHRALRYRLAYGRRINRPGAQMLNPFSMPEDDMNETIGNPSLRPEISDQLELGMERHGSRVTLQLTPFLRWTRDPIRALKTGTPRGGTTTTLQNLNRSSAIGADGSVRARPTERSVVTLTGSVAHMETTGEVFSNSGMYATARLTVDLQMAENTTAQLYAYRRSAQVIEQGEILPAFTSEVAVTQRLARDRGRVTLRVNDPFRSDRLEFQIADATFTQASRRRTARPLLSLFASYAVGGAPREDAPVRTDRPAQIF